MERGMDILIGTGASGGHIYPALAAARVLRARGHHVVFAGVFRQWTDLMLKEGFECVELPLKKWDIKSIKSVPVSFGCMLQSLVCAARLVAQRRPDRIVGFGGYGSVPVVLAGYLRRVPVFIHEQNASAGRANRFLGRLARGIMVSFPGSARVFPKAKVAVTGYPLRQFSQALPREACLNKFGMQAGVVTVAVCGGSQGSRTLNQIAVQTAGLLRAKTEVQILHITGKQDEEIVRMGYERLGIRHQVFPFFHEMEKIYRSADVMIARAGAGLIHEILYFGIPAVIVPYPYAGAHQKWNAAAFVREGRGLMIEEKYLTAQRLCGEIMNLLNHQGGEAACPPGEGLLKIDAAERIADIVTGDGL